MNRYSTLLENDTQAQVTMPEDIVQYIDEQLGETYANREDFLRAAVQHYAKYLHEAESMIQRSVKPGNRFAHM